MSHGSPGGDDTQERLRRIQGIDDDVETAHSCHHIFDFAVENIKTKLQKFPNHPYAAELSELVTFIEKSVEQADFRFRLEQGPFTTGVGRYNIMDEKTNTRKTADYFIFGKDFPLSYCNESNNTEGLMMESFRKLWILSKHPKSQKFVFLGSHLAAAALTKAHYFSFLKDTTENFLPTNSWDRTLVEELLDAASDAPEGPKWNRWVSLNFSHLQMKKEIDEWTANVETLEFAKRELPFNFLYSLLNDPKNRELYHLVEDAKLLASLADSPDMLAKDFRKGRDFVLRFQRLRTYVEGSHRLVGALFQRFVVEDNKLVDSRVADEWSRQDKQLFGLYQQIQHGTSLQKVSDLESVSYPSRLTPAGEKKVQEIKDWVKQKQLQMRSPKRSA